MDLVVLRQIGTPTFIALDPLTFNLSTFVLISNLCRSSILFSQKKDTLIPCTSNYQFFQQEDKKGKLDLTKKKCLFLQVNRVTESA